MQSSPPYRVKLKVNGQLFTTEVDTGAAVSLVPESAVAAVLLPSNPHPTNVLVNIILESKACC